MSGGIGITFQPNASLHLAIENLVPDGPAHNSGRCHKDDVLTRIDDQVGICVGIFVFFTLVTSPRRSLSLGLIVTRVYEPQIRARLGTTAHFWWASAWGSARFCRQTCTAGRIGAVGSTRRSTNTLDHQQNEAAITFPDARAVPKSPTLTEIMTQLSREPISSLTRAGQTGCAWVGHGPRPAAHHRPEGCAAPPLTAGPFPLLARPVPLSAGDESPLYIRTPPWRGKS